MLRRMCIDYVKPKIFETMLKENIEKWEQSHIYYLENLFSANFWKYFKKKMHFG